MTDYVNEEWSKLSLLVANDPDNFTNWENLVKVTTKGLSKVTPKSTLDLFRITNDQFLLKFPFLEQYWVNYASTEFKLGNTDKAREIYERCLEIIPHSNIIWLNYLKLLKVVLLDYDKLISYYRLAEDKIGLHFHSYEFWKDFIEVELSHNGKTVYYFNLFKKVLSIPIYNYSYFFKLFFNEIDQITEETLIKLVPDHEILKKLKVNPNQKILKHEFHEIKSKLKKLFTDSYITTQYKTFQYYHFEKNIKLEYFVPGLYKSYQELTNWEKYLSYMEINGTFKQVEELYNRALVPLQNYPQFWLKFADFYLSKNKLQEARQILTKSLLFLNSSNLSNIQVKLIRIEVYLNNILKARDMALIILENNQALNKEISYEILLEFIKLEKMLNTEGSEIFKEFLLDLIKNHISVDASLMLMECIYSNFIDFQGITDFINLFNEDIRFKKKSKYWVVLLNASKNLSRSNLIEIYNKAIENVGNDDTHLIQWYETYLSYEGISKNELSLNFEQSSKLLFDQ